MYIIVYIFYTGECPKDGYIHNILNSVSHFLDTDYVKKEHNSRDFNMF